MVSRSWPNTDCAYFVPNGLPVAPWVTTMPRSNLPEQTRTKAMRSRCDGSLLACTLNAQAENGESSRRGEQSTSSRGDGDGARSTMAASSRRRAKRARQEEEQMGGGAGG